MNRIRSDIEIGWDLLLALSLVAIAISAWLLYSRPRPARPSTAGIERSIRQTRESIRYEEELAMLATHATRTHTSDATPEMLGAQILSSLTDVAAKHQVQVTRFRYVRSIPLVNIVGAQFMASFDGNFVDLLDVLKAIESPDSVTALNNVRFGKTTGTGLTSATVNLTGFLFREAK